ncbi:MAG TPA: MASE2 domain-containing protein [Chryseosolibacter sp.]|nr:MASE2 domain-containing protein [Chryseosolibacter sp.]
MLRSPGNIWKQSKGIGRLSYTFRMMAYVSAMLMMIAYYHEQNFQLGFLEYLTVFLVATVPHAILYVFVRSGRRTSVVFDALQVDFFLIGWIIGIIDFSIIPSIVFILGGITNHVAARGFNKLHHILLVPVGCLVIYLVDDFSFHFESSQLINLLTAGHGIIHYVTNSYVLHVSINRVRNQNSEIRKQRADIEEKSEELRVLNESLRDMNANLELKVLHRTAELQQKTRKLEEYAFINAHELRGPVARVLGLIHLLDFKNISENETILEQLRTTAKELDNATKDIRAKLEAEG